MKARKYNRIHFVGIGGSGMSGIAELLLNLGYRVSGSDIAESDLTRRLASLGARIYKGHSPSNVGDADVVVYSSAVKPDNPEIVEAKERGIPVIRRAEMLAELMRLKYGIAVAGAHGKTTTTSMIAHILAHAGLDPTAVIGGKVQGLGSGAKMGQGDYLVAEADESDGSFLRLTPTITVVTNIDREHLDHYRDLRHIQDTFVEFVNRIPFYGAAVLCLDDPHIPGILNRLERRVITYGLSPQADIQAHNIGHHGTTSSFSVFKDRCCVGELTIPVPGRHNVLNALAAVGVAMELEVPFQKIQEAMAGFKGIERRFQVKGVVNGITLVDDYGHHPTEIRATLSAAKMSWGKRLVVIFQPHRYTRTYHLFEDFLTAFHDADLLFLLDIYPAGEEPIEGITSKVLWRAIKEAGHREAVYLEDRGELIKEVTKRLCPGDVVITLGAGDVWKVGEELLRTLKEGVGSD